MEWIKSILEILKLDKKSTFVAAMVCSALLIFKGVIEKHFNAQYFYDHFEMFVLIMAFLMWAVLLADFLIFVEKKIKIKWQIKKEQRFLAKLKDRRLKIVAEMYFTPNHSKPLQIGDSDVLSLSSHGVILRTAQQTTIDSYEVINNPFFTHILQPWAVDYFDKHKGKIKQYEDD